MGIETPFPSNQRKGYLPRRRRIFGGKRQGRIISPPVAQVNTINASNAIPLRSQSPTSDEDDPVSVFVIQYLTATQLLRKSRDLIQTKENQTDEISKLQSKIW